MSDLMKIENIARVCHEANRAIQQIANNPNNEVTKSWDEITEDLRKGIRKGVQEAIDGKSPEELHKKWCEFKYNQGWKYGPIKDESKKTHPCLTSYDCLSKLDKIKDELFIAIVNVLKDA